MRLVVRRLLSLTLALGALARFAGAQSAPGPDSAAVRGLARVLARADSLWNRGDTSSRAIAAHEASIALLRTPTFAAAPTCGELAARRVERYYETPTCAFERSLSWVRTVTWHQELAAIYERLGAIRLLRGEPRPAAAAYTAAADVALGDSDVVDAAQSLTLLGYSRRLLGQPDSARAAIGRAIALLRARGVGRIVDEPTAFAAIPSLRRRLDSLMLAGTAAGDTAAEGRRDRARAETDSLLRGAYPRHFEWAVGRHVDEAGWSLGLAYAHLGALHRAAGRRDSAYANLRRAVIAYEIAGERRSFAPLGDAESSPHVHEELVCGVLARRARCHPAANPVAEEELRLAGARWIGDVTGELRILQSLARVYESGGNPDSAAAMRRELAELRAAVLGDGKSEVAMTRGAADRPATPGDDEGALARARGFDRSGALDSAAADYERVGAEAAAGSGLESLRLAAQAWRAAADVLVRLHRPDSALARVHDSIRLLAERGDDFCCTLVRFYAAHLERAESMLAAAHLYHRALPRPDLWRAVAYYDSASAAYSNALVGAPGDAERVAIAERTTELYDEWTLAWLARSGDVELDEELDDAFGAMEEGRGRSLALLVRGPATIERGTPGEEEFRPRGSALHRGLRGSASGRSSATELDLGGADALLSYLATRDTLIVWLKLESYRPPRVFRTAVPRDTLARWVATVRAASASPVARLRGVPVRALERGVDDDDSIAPTPAAYAAALRSLHAALLPDSLRRALPDTGTLVIVATGFLNQLPFAVLAPDTVTEPLGIRYALRYAPSLRFAAGGDDESTATGLGLDMRTPDDSIRRARQARMRRALVVADPAMPTVTSPSGAKVTLHQLPGARAEGAIVARRLGVAPVTGGAATESFVRARLRTAPVVHLATHGYAYADPAKARRSFIALAPGGRDDGLFTAEEILADSASTIAAELVVLSACQTALGAPTRSEGTVGLQRALLARGARTLLVSLWSVSDEATAMLMDRFYQHWLDPTHLVGKAEALRLAQGDVRRRYPRDWAAFQLIGRP